MQSLTFGQALGRIYFFACWIELVTTRVDLLFRFRRKDNDSAFLETVVGRAQPELNDHGPSVPPPGDWIEDKPLTGSEVWSTACFIRAGHPDISIRPPSEDGRPHCSGCPTSRRTWNRGTQVAAICVAVSYQKGQLGGCREKSPSTTLGSSCFTQSRAASVHQLVAVRFCPPKAMRVPSAGSHVSHDGICPHASTGRFKCQPEFCP